VNGNSKRFTYFVWSLLFLVLVIFLGIYLSRSVTTRYPQLSTKLTKPAPLPEAVIGVNNTWPLEKNIELDVYTLKCRAINPRFEFTQILTNFFILYKTDCHYVGANGQPQVITIPLAFAERLPENRSYHLVLGYSPKESITYPREEAIEKLLSEAGFTENNQINVAIGLPSPSNEGVNGRDYLAPYIKTSPSQVNDFAKSGDSSILGKNFIPITVSLNTE